MKNLRTWVRRTAVAATLLVAAVAVVTAIVSSAVNTSARHRIYTDVASAPRNRVALLLGTSPHTRGGRTNVYFSSRIAIAACLYHQGKVDYIIASGDNRTRYYNEPWAMRNALLANGVPEERIVLDYAGFRTLDSVVRAREVFGCDTLTIISQADHCARALYIARANGIEAVAVAAPIRPRLHIRARMAVREWLARDKMMLDLIFGKRPHFLGDKIKVGQE